MQTLPKGNNKDAQNDQDVRLQKVCPLLKIPSLRYVFTRALRKQSRSYDIIGNQLIIINDYLSFQANKQWKEITSCFQTHGWKAQEFIYNNTDAFKFPNSWIRGSVLAQNFSNLQNLKLKLDSCRPMSDIEYQNFIIEITRNLVQLKQFTLALYKCCRMSKESFCVIVKEVTHNLPKLILLETTFTDSDEIDDKCLKFMVSQVCLRLPKLKYLSLTFSRCPLISDYGLHNLFSSDSRYLRHLEQLKLDFSRCTEISDKGFIGLIPNISRHFINLKALSLRFIYVTKLTNKCLTSFETFKFPGTLAALKHLSLDFSRCLQITSKGLEEIALILKKKKCPLQSCTIYFGEGYQTDDDSSKDIRKILNFVPNTRIYS